MNFIKHSLLALLTPLTAFANDGAFYAKGNHLIPMYETDISVKKEILTVKRINKNQVKIDVYYEFYNPLKEKTVEVGFEAASPTGDVNGTPVNGQHPYMKGFNVNLNNQTIPYSVAIVNDSVYYKKRKFISKKLSTVLKEIDNINEVNFFYVYHFKALFKNGHNILKHSYTLDLSNGVMYRYYFEYVLTAAKRWANGQIDDFTLKIDMGELEEFYIYNSFYNDNKEWLINGIGKSEPTDAGSVNAVENDASWFCIRNGNILFKKNNFKPNGELTLLAIRHFNHTKDDFNYKEDDLPYAIDDQDNIGVALNDTSFKILQNLPFARRGYVFSNPILKAYYEKQQWYIADPLYKPKIEALTKKEKNWLKNLK